MTNFSKIYIYFLKFTFTSDIAQPKQIKETKYVGRLTLSFKITKKLYLRKCVTILRK